MTATIKHLWLERVSAYHSGGVSDAERTAIEEHLTNCSECQEALMRYRRFYTLARSPLRLGPPSLTFAEEPGSPSRVAPAQPPRRPRPPHRRVLAGLGAALAAVLILTGFVAVLATRLRSPTLGATPALPTATRSMARKTPIAITPVSTTSTAQLPPFICANSVGSSTLYAYVRADLRTYVVNGCAQPRQVASQATTPLAWSPSHRYLAIMTSAWPAADALEVVDLQTASVLHTAYSVDFGSEPPVGSKLALFAGWLDDSSFLGVVTPLVAGANGDERPDPSSLVRVDLPSGTETPITTIGGWVNMGSGPLPVDLRLVNHGRTLFYAGYDSGGTSAHLHRVDLATGTDTTLVSLGLYGNGGCQGTVVCGWTAPWDVSADGRHIFYHSPGAASTPSDTNSPGDTPVLYAAPDGSAATQPFGSALAAVSSRRCSRPMAPPPLRPAQRTPATLRSERVSPRASSSCSAALPSSSAVACSTGAGTARR